MNKKIVFFDIDGTLYSYKKGIPEDTKLALRLLQEEGHIPVICTGRTKAMIFPEMLNLNTSALIAGAGTYLEVEGTPVYEYRMESALAREVIASMEACNIMPIPEGIEYLYYPLTQINAGYQKIYETYREKVPEHIRDYHLYPDLSVSKISGKISEQSDIKAMRIKYQDQFNFVLHGDILLELIPKGYSKAVGIEKLLEYYNAKNWKISIEDTYAYGDSMNDFEMLQYVRHGVAMGNSTFEFKNQIRYVTEEYDQGGIYQSLRRFGLIK